MQTHFIVTTSTPSYGIPPQLVVFAVDKYGKNRVVQLPPQLIESAGIVAGDVIVIEKKE